MNRSFFLLNYLSVSIFIFTANSLNIYAAQQQPKTITYAGVANRLKQLHLMFAQAAVQDSVVLQDAFKTSGLPLHDIDRTLHGLDILLTEVNSCLHKAATESQQRAATPAPQTPLSQPKPAPHVSPNATPKATTARAAAVSFAAQATVASAAAGKHAAQQTQSPSPANAKQKEHDELLRKPNGSAAGPSRPAPAKPAVAAAPKAKTEGELLEEVPKKIDALVALTADKQKVAQLVAKLKIKSNHLSMPPALNSPNQNVDDIRDLFSALIAQDSRLAQQKGKQIFDTDAFKRKSSPTHESTVTASISSNRVFLCCLQGQMKLKDLEAFHAFLDALTV